MPSKIRHRLIISITVVALLFASVMTSYPETKTYIYDELNRLIRVEYEDGTVVEYTYDKAGNRLEKKLQIADTTPIAYVNGSSKSEDPSGNSIAAPAQNHTSGNLLVVVVGSYSSVSVSSVTDTAGNTYISCNKRASYAGVGWCEIWYAKNITGNSSNAVTATLSGNAYHRTIHVLQFSGCDTSDPYDGGNTNVGNSSSQSTNPAITTQANELMVAGYRVLVLGSFTAGTSPFQFTLSGQTTPRLATEYRLDTGAAGSYGSSMTYSTSGGYAASHVTFKKQNN